MEESETDELVTRLREGDETAFRRAYDAHRAAIYSFIVRMTRRRDIAEDLLQETFMRLARHAQRLAPDTRLRPWLFTVARNLVVSQHRSDLLTMRPLLEWWTGGSASPFEELAASETERRLERALARLPAKYRESLLLCAVEEMDRGQAARVLELSSEALRQRLARARGMLKQELARAEDKS